ncbi:unnamed protein product [Owenia fusiformis]|uniref:CUB domain-containing protein n=1 Tax=Owenia fusiformis TaxID=6347 RepID=A0A8S4Q285_OWEFU|nr:unnamed protein product [Owenia fusiformis]
MDFGNIILGTLFLGQIVLQTYGQYAQQTANKCFSVPGVPKLDFDACKPGDMILITTALQGISRSPGQCSYLQGDCTEPVTSETDEKLHKECIGKESCSITVSVAWMPRCSAYSNYNQVMYYCIPKINTQNICVRDGRFGLKRGFLSTPNYPDSYTSDQDCHCNMTTAPGKKLKFKFPDSALEWSHSCTKDKVKIMDGGQAITRCGKLPRMYNYTTYSNTVEVHFISDNWKEDKGFWLQYEADSNIEVFCGPTNWVPTTTTTTTEAPTTTPKPGSSSEGTYLGPSDPTNDNTSLVGIIIAAVIGFIVLVVLIVLLIRFRRKRHMEKISKAPVEPARHPKLHKHHGDKPPGSPGAPGGPTTPKANKHNEDDKDDKP